MKKQTIKEVKKPSFFEMMYCCALYYRNKLGLRRKLEFISCGNISMLKTANLFFIFVIFSTLFPSEVYIPQKGGYFIITICMAIVFLVDYFLLYLRRQVIAERYENCTEAEKKKGRIRFWIYVVGSVLLVLFPRFYSPQPDKQVESAYTLTTEDEYVYHVNQMCPVVSEDGNRLVSLEKLKDHVIVYNHIAPDKPDWILRVDSFKYHIPQILYNFEYRKIFKMFRDNQTSFIYRYRNSKKELIYEFSITPEEYLNYKPDSTVIPIMLESIVKTYAYIVPIVFEDGSCFYEMKYKKPSTLVYCYKINSDFQEGDASNYKSFALDALSNSDLWILLANNVTFVYQFCDKNSRNAITIELKPEDYQEILKEAIED